MSDQAAAAGQVPAIKRVYVRAWLEPDREYVHPPFSGDLLPIIFDEPSDDDELLPRLTWMRREDVIEAAAAGPVPAEAVEAALVAYSQDPREVPAMQAALAAAAPLIAANRDANIERLKGAIKALDNGLAQHGEHIERLTAERDAAEAKIAAALMLLNPSVQSFSRETILKVRAALGGGTSDTPGGPR